MKGLLYKEWCLGKKNCGLFLALSLVFCLLGILVFLSMICGNLQSWPSKEPESVKVFAMTFTYVPYILMLFTATSVNQSIFTDYESGWMKYSYTLPHKAIKVIGAKYVYVGITFVIAFIFGLVNAGVICFMSKETFSSDTLKNMVVIMVFAVVEMAVVIPLAILFKQGRTLSTIGAVFFMAVYIISGYILVELEEKYPGKVEKILPNLFVDVRDILTKFSILIIVLVIIVSIYAACKIYQRREK